jgi:hypothetical protein
MLLRIIKQAIRENLDLAKAIKRSIKKKQIITFINKA